MGKQVTTKQNVKIQGKVEVDAVELKTIEIRINEIKDSTQRSRFVFIVMTIAATTILIALWNGMLSWERGMAFEKRSYDHLISTNQDLVTSEWIKNLNISVGLFGIRISVNDLAVIGSLGLIIIMVWYFFSQRRENRAIVGLLRYCYKGFKDKQLSKEVCNLVFEAIVQSIVFINMGGGDKPIKGIVETDEPSESKVIIRTILKILVFLPPFTIFMIVISDIASLFMHSYLREEPKMLWKVLVEKKQWGQVTKIVVFDLFAISVGIYIGSICYRCKEFSRATSETIKEYKDKMLS